MKVWTCNDHKGFYVGACSVVVADTEDQARELLEQELKDRGLSGSGNPFTLNLLDVSIPCAHVLIDGDY